MPSGVTLGLASGERWLLTFVLATAAVLIVGSVIRRTARRPASRGTTTGTSRGVRRRAGFVLAVGPLIGLVASALSDERAWATAIGAVVLGAVGIATDRRPDKERIVFLAIAASAGLAVALDVRLGPTGVELVDVLGAAVVIMVVAAALNGLGNSDGLGAGIGAAGALGVFGLAGFAGQTAVAGVAAGLGAACLAFLAFNLPPASLWLGTGGRLVIGYSLAVGILSTDLPVGPTSRLMVPLIFLGVFLLDAVVVTRDRLTRRRSLVERRRDHLIHRLVAAGWRQGEAVAALVAGQLLLSVIAVFAGRGVLALWVAVALAIAVVALLGAAARRAPTDRRPAPGLSGRAKVVVGIIVLAMLLAVVPTAFAATDVRSLMEDGRREATRGLAAARDGDDVGAELAFRRAAAAFAAASDELGSVILEPGLLVPGLAPNLRAARTLADVGRDLATAGTAVTAAVDQERLEVVNGLLPLEEVTRVTPALEDGARALDRALRRVHAIDTTYLLSSVRDPLRDITKQLGQAAGEATRAAAAARLASAIFGGDEPRTYLLVVQNNAELRATGGLMTDWGLLTAVDGDLEVGELSPATAWNSAVQTDPSAQRGAPADFEALHGFRPAFAMQDANLSPHFPTAATVLTNLSRSAGLPPLDGVLAVDAFGLKALLELTGPVRVPGWPTEISASNVVDITMRDQYAQFEDQGQRSEFLGDVTQAVVDEATAGALGSPARIAQVLGASAHEGHLLLWFTRPDEQRLAEQLDVAGDLDPVRSDSLGVYTQNSAANKIDYYLQRSVEYRVRLEPMPDGRHARIDAQLTLRLENTAPDTGLPRIVIGPFNDEYVAGQNRALVAIYSPLKVVGAVTVDGAEQIVRGSPDAGRETYWLEVDVPARSTRVVELRLQGVVRLHHGWYELDIDHQATLQPDRVQVSVAAPAGWALDPGPGLTRVLDHRAMAVAKLERDLRLRARVVQAPEPLDLWERLQAGT